MSWPHAVPGSAVQRVVEAQAFLALEHSSRATIAQWQAIQLSHLVQWLWAHVPWWRDRLPGHASAAEAWAQAPILTRFHLMQMLAQQGAAPVPAHHGHVESQPLPFDVSGTARFYMSAFAQRLANHAFYADHQRQSRNPYLTQACITDDVPVHSGAHLLIEASQADGMGRQALRNVGLFSKAQHMEWIGRIQPSYLTVRPDWFEAALVHAVADKMALPDIRQLLTFGATATDSLRRKARRWLGASVRHRYTSPLCGPLAFQCPRSDDHLHVAVGNVMLEVVSDGTSAPSGPVLVTALHQYATPLVRYDTGDTAILHDGCPGCGLAVPTLSALRQNV